MNNNVEVLLVDDCPFMAEAIKGFLDDPRIRLTVSRDGEEGIAAYKNSAFDLVLMDIQMPNVDGCAATRAIRQWELENRKRRTPIAALTGSTEFSDLAKIYKSGCSHYLPKPVTRTILLQALHQYVLSRGRRS